jgi:ATP-dependent RNA helicase DeaD
MGIGRIGGIGPGDLVGAITNEAGITGDAIGAIEIGERFSVVELQEDVVERVLHAMRKARINGRKVPVRRFVEK